MKVDFYCPICKEKMPMDLKIIIPHGETHITEAIKEKHPEWAESNGTCQKCYEYYKKQIHPE